MEGINHFVEVSEAQVLACARFASASLDSKYRERGGKGDTRAQIFAGKLGEFACLGYLSGAFDVPEPDIAIYGAKDKSWAPDLMLDGSIKCHVKTCDKRGKGAFPESWIFQVADREVFETYSELDLGIFVTRVEERLFVIRYMVPIAWLHDRNLFQATILSRFQTSKDPKLAVYAFPCKQSTRGIGTELRRERLLGTLASLRK